MSNAVFDLMGRVSADVTPFDNAMTASAKSASGAFQTMSVAANAFIGNGVIRSFISASNAANKFGQTLADISSIASYNIKSLRDSILSLDNVYGKASNMGETMYEVISSGIRGSESELVKFAKVAQQTAVSIKADLYDTANVLTTLTNAYGLSVKDAQKLSDMLFVTVREGKAHGNELARTLGLVTNTAAEAGVSLSEMAATISILSRTQSASQSMIGFNQLLNSIIKPTQEAQREARYWGIELSATALKTKGLSGVLEELHQKTGGNVRAINAMLGNIRAMRAGVSLTGRQFENFINILKMAEYEIGSGVAYKAFEKQTDTTAQAVKNLQTQVDKTAITIGSDLEPAVKLLSNTAESILKAFNDSNYIVRWTTYISIVGTVVGGTLKAFQGIRNTVKSLTTGMGGVASETKGAADAAKQFSDSIASVNTNVKALAANIADIKTMLSNMPSMKPASVPNVQSDLQAPRTRIGFNTDNTNNIKETQTTQGRIVVNPEIDAALKLKHPRGADGRFISKKMHTSNIVASVLQDASMAHNQFTNPISERHLAYNRAYTVANSAKYPELSDKERQWYIDRRVHNTLLYNRYKRFVARHAITPKQVDESYKRANSIHAGIPVPRTFTFNPDNIGRDTRHTFDYSALGYTTKLRVTDKNAPFRYLNDARNFSPLYGGDEIFDDARRGHNFKGTFDGKPLKVRNGSVAIPNLVYGYTTYGSNGIKQDTLHDEIEKRSRAIARQRARAEARATRARSEGWSGDIEAARRMSTETLQRNRELLKKQQHQAAVIDRFNRMYGTHLKSMPKNRAIRGWAVGISKFGGAIGKLTGGLASVFSTIGILGMAASTAATAIKAIVDKITDDYVENTTKETDSKIVTGMRKAANDRLSLAYKNKKVTEAEYKVFDSAIELATSQEQLAKIIQDIANAERKRTKTTLTEDLNEIEKKRSERVTELKRARVDGALPIDPKTKEAMKKAELEQSASVADEYNAIAIRHRTKKLGKLAPEMERTETGKNDISYGPSNHIPINKLNMTQDMRDEMLKAFSEEQWEKPVEALRNKFAEAFDRIDSTPLEKKFYNVLMRNMDKLAKIRQSGGDVNAEIKQVNLDALRDKGEAVVQHSFDVLYNSLDDVTAQADIPDIEKGESAVTATLPKRLKLVKTAEDQIKALQERLKKLKTEAVKQYGLTEAEASNVLKGLEQNITTRKTQFNDLVSGVDSMRSEHIKAIESKISSTQDKDNYDMSNPRERAIYLRGLLADQQSKASDSNRTRIERDVFKAGADYIQGKLDSAIDERRDNYYKQLQLKQSAGMMSEYDVLRAKSRFEQNRYDNEVSYRDDYKKGTEAYTMQSKRVTDASMHLRASLLELNKASGEAASSLRNSFISQIQSFTSGDDARDSKGRLTNDALYHSINLMSRLSGGDAIRPSKGANIRTSESNVSSYKNANAAQTAMMRNLDSLLMSQKYAEANQSRTVTNIYTLLKQNIGKGISI